MNGFKPGRPRATLTANEERVLQALLQLPPEYEVLTGTRLQFEKGLLSYEPDFVIRRNDGREVVLEVKSSHSLSMSNLSRLTRVSFLLRREGKGFVVIVLSSDLERSPTRALSEFNELRVRSVTSDSEIVRTTLEEFQQLPSLG